MEIIEMRAGSLLEDFDTLGMPPLMSVSPELSFDILGRSLGGTFRQSSDGGTMHFNNPDCAEKSFVMVRPSVTNHRDVYLKFINSRYETNFSNSDLPQGFDVDHLLAKSNCPSTNWIRLEAVLSTINRSHGGGVEKRNSTSQVIKARKSAEHRPGSMTWLVAAKLAMIKSPLAQKAKSTSARKEALVEYFVSRGFERNHVEVGITACQHDLAD
uniref:hypothetical protein n=1 Tax=Ruegeria arenilitoris TaxID=1173585 RepID=UPI00147A6427|nr:hypothetical protein [Ruegeria arenilitoris]